MTVATGFRTRAQAQVAAKFYRAKGAIRVLVYKVKRIGNRGRWRVYYKAR